MKRILSGTVRLLALLAPMVFGGWTAEAALTVGAVQATDVTPSGFAVSWQASSASTAQIAVYADAAGTAEVTTFLEIRPSPVRGGDPAVTDGYLARRAREALQDAVRALGLAKIEVQGCAPDTMYYYRVFSEGAGGEVAVWPEAGLSSVRTAKENSFVADSRQLLVTIPAGGGTVNATGWLVRVSTAEALAPVSAIVGDGAGANRAYLNLTQLFGSGGLNWAPPGAKELDLEILGGPDGPVHQTVSVPFNGDFSVATVQPVTLSGRQQFAVTTAADPGAGGSVTGAGTYNAGDTATLTATANSGYQFVSWSGDATGTTNPLIVTVGAAKSITATFSRITYAVTTAANPVSGGSVTGAGTYNAGDTATLTATANSGYQFVSWSGDATGTTNPLIVTVGAAKSITATFSRITYAVTTAANPVSGGSVTGAGTYNAGDTATLTATANSGYQFVSWSGDATGTTNPLTVTVGAAKSITANFSRITYAVTTAANPVSGGSVTGAGTYNAGDTATLTATANSGYQFVSWSGDATGTTNPLTVTVGAAKSITANFSRITYAVTTAANPVSGGSVTGAGTYNAGDTATLTATANSGYQFVSWSGDATGTTNPLTVTVGAARSITANFSRITYAVTTAANPTAGGSVTGAGTYNAGDTATLTATANSGYQFVSWSGDATGTTNPLTVTVGAARSITANFSRIIYAVTTAANPVSGGSVTGAGTYNAGDTATLTATANSGYQFVSWSGDATGTANPLTVTVGAARSITANFVLRQAPTLDPIGPKAVTEGQTLAFAVIAQDPDGYGLVYRASNLPTGATFDPATQVFAWTPATGWQGNYTVTFSVVDQGVPPLGASETITITVSPVGGKVDAPPVLDPIGPRQVTESVLLSFAVTASDPDGDPIAYGADNLPAGATFAADSGVFRWTPTQDQRGTHYVTFRATSGDPPLADVEIVAITVGNGNRPPTLDPIGGQSLGVGASFHLVVTASDPDRDALTFSTSTLPGGATFDPLTQVFDWTPVAPGNYAVIFTVADSGDPALDDSETVTFTVGDVNRPPILDPMGDRSATENEPLTFFVTGSDPDGDELTFSMIGLPDGATFDPATGEFRWTPSLGQAGNYSLTVTVEDGGVPPLSASGALSIAVASAGGGGDGGGGGGGGGGVCFVSAAGSALAASGPFGGLRLLGLGFVAFAVLRRRPR